MRVRGRAEMGVQVYGLRDELKITPLADFYYKCVFKTGTAGGSEKRNSEIS